ncbi:hypothetical protein ACR82Z_01100 [Mycoplasma sp. 6243]|uniref:hypothetical protein n=1 Tax=Mycoplasma sp. 6243 TaxID=3440865 RepID=UPI003EB94A2F
MFYLIKFPKWKYQYIIRSLIYTFFSLLIIKYIFSLVGGHFKFLYRSFIYSHKGYKSFWDGLDNTYIKNKILENMTGLNYVKAKFDLYIKRRKFIYKRNIIFKTIWLIILLYCSISLIVIYDPYYNILGILMYPTIFKLWIFLLTFGILVASVIVIYFIFIINDVAFNINDTFEKWIQNKYKDFFIKQKHDEEQEQIRKRYEEYLKWKRPSEDEKL